MNNVEIARKIATKAHKGQFRWDGITPYITHPQAVSCAVKDDNAKCVAWLHDVVEDTDITIQDLKNEYFSAPIIEAVDVLTRRKSQDYLSYLLLCKNNPLARIVKIADITHNLSDLEYEKNHSRYEKYILAKYILEI